MSYSKQVLLVRTDIGMGPGKIASQTAHASTAWLTKRINGYGHLYVVNLPNGWLDYIEVPTHKKVVLAVHSRDELLSLAWRAQDAGLEVNVIQDEGLTVFGGHLTYTCAAIGPNKEEDIDNITGYLDLLE